MKIETKFDVGDAVYFIYIKHIYAKETCQLCNGEKKILLSYSSIEKTYKCPQCSGGGYMDKSQNIYKIFCAPTVVVKIMYQSYGGNNESTLYEVNDCRDLQTEDKLFYTIREAQAECDRLNKRNDNNNVCVAE